jgi:CBS domain-containing protein
LWLGPSAATDHGVGPTRLVSDYAIRILYTASPDEDLETCDARMREHGVSSLLVVGRDGAAAGVLSRADVLRIGHVYSKACGRSSFAALPRMGVGDAMTWGVTGVGLGDSIEEAARRMVTNRVHRLYVLDDGHACGVIGTAEIMRAVLDRSLASPIAGFMSSPVITVDLRDTLEEAVTKLEAAEISSLVVVEDAAPVGIFTQAEALQARTMRRTDPVEDAMSQALLCLPVTTPLHRAAGFTLSTRARRIVCVERRHMRGVMTGLDFARALAPSERRPESARARA